MISIHGTTNFNKVHNSLDNITSKNAFTPNNYGC